MVIVFVLDINTGELHNLKKLDPTGTIRFSKSKMIGMIRLDQSGEDLEVVKPVLLGFLHGSVKNSRGVSDSC